MKLKLLIAITITLFLNLPLFAQGETIKWQKDYKKAVVLCYWILLLFGANRAKLWTNSIGFYLM
jgi:hypothetical protein